MNYSAKNGTANDQTKLSNLQELVSSNTVKHEFIKCDPEVDTTDGFNNADRNLSENGKHNLNMDIKSLDIIRSVEEGTKFIKTENPMLPVKIEDTDDTSRIEQERYFVDIHKLDSYMQNEEVYIKSEPAVYKRKLIRNLSEIDKHSAEEGTKFIKTENAGLPIKIEDIDDTSREEQEGYFVDIHKLDSYIQNEVHIKSEPADYKSFSDPPSVQHLEMPQQSDTIETNSATTSATPMVHCKLCTFKTKYKGSLNTHMLSHKHPSELTMYKCELCTLETRYKHDIKRHMLVHKHPSELQMYSCKLCSYVTKYKYGLSEHMILHKSSSEIPMFKCTVCPFETKHKSSLRGHMIIHQDVRIIKKSLEKPTVKCGSCAYTTKYKGNLRLHMLIHKDPSELTMFKCDLCSFECKRKLGLNRHKKRHKKSPDVVVLKCELCTFKTKRKSSLTNHMIVHTAPSEVTMFKCELCSFETKHKKELTKHHNRKHKN